MKLIQKFKRVLNDSKDGKKLVAALTALATTVTMIVGLLTYDYAEAQEDLIGNQRYQPVVAETIGADMEIMRRFSHNYKDDLDKLVRFMPSQEGKVYVNVEDNVSPRAKANIQKTFKHMNSAFGLINSSYNFVPCSNQEYEKHIKQNSPAIQFKYDSINTYGVLGQTGNFDFNRNFIKGINKGLVYITNATITLNSDVFETLTDAEQLFIIKHEILHVLGFDDLYDDYDDETSVMNVGMIGLTEYLSPNDLKMLYVAYGNKHLNKNGSLNKQALQEVKEKIDKYEQMYYQYIMEKVFTHTTLNFEPITPEDAYFTIIIKDSLSVSLCNGTFTFNYGDYSKHGKYVAGDNYIIVPDVKIGGNNDFLVIGKIDGHLQAFDLFIRHEKTVDEPIGDVDIIFK